MWKPACMLTIIVVTAVVAGSSTEAQATRMVTVPLVTQTNVVRAYDLLRDAGLRVAIRNGFSAGSLCVPIAQKQSPRQGTRTAVGNVVTITAGFCPLGSPAVAKPMPTATVPSFAGKSARSVVGWATRLGMYWAVRKLPPLAESEAPHLFDNYRVIRQQPSPGMTLRPGLIVNVGGRPGFRPTPITIWVEAR
jgi:beta-lactam-binding protein with PASTA domain